MMDVMGNVDALHAIGGKTAISFSRPGQPFFLFSSKNLSGSDLAKLLTPFEKPNVVLAEGVYGLPTDWLAQGKGRQSLSVQGQADLAPRTGVPSGYEECCELPRFP